MTVRMKDIAEYLGVSRATVSLALNHTPGSTISEETRHKIIQAAKELGYKDFSASSQIAFILYGRDSDDPRYMDALKQIEKTVRSHHYKLSFISISASPAEHVNLRHFLASKELKGAIVTGDIDETIVRLMEQSEAPYLIYGGPVYEQVHMMIPDHRKAAYEAVNYLIRLGHRRIALFSGSLDAEVHKLGLDGYRQALEESGIGIDKELIQVGREEDGYEMCGRMEALNIPYTAAYCVNTVIQFGVLQRLKELGVSVPGDISLVGYGITELVRASVPKLTAVYVEPSENETMVRRLMDMIQHPDRPAEVQYMSRLGLFEGGTCAMYFGK